MTRMKCAAILLATGCGSAPHPAPIEARDTTPAGEYRIERRTTHETIGDVIDLRPPRAREYYRISLVTETAAALVPRPDDELATACKTTSQLTEIAQRAGLCDVAVSEGPFVERINRLPIEDALRVKRVLERSLRFAAHEDERGDYWYVWPFPNKSDVTAICARPNRAGLSKDICWFWSPEHTTEEMRFFAEDDTKLLAKRLNELYGPAR